MKDIKGYEGLYAVTSCGKVWSYGSKKFLKPIVDKDGYLLVNLYRNGISTQTRIHRLVAEAYLSNPDNLPQVNHIDGNKGNNSINNLEFCTATQNLCHAYKTGLIKKKKVTKRVHDQTTGFTYSNCSEAARAIDGNQRGVWKACNKKAKNYKNHVFTYID